MLWPGVTSPPTQGTPDISRAARRRREQTSLQRPRSGPTPWTPPPARPIGGQRHPSRGKHTHLRSSLCVILFFTGHRRKPYRPDPAPQNSRTGPPIHARTWPYCRPDYRTGPCRCGPTHADNHMPKHRGQGFCASVLPVHGSCRQPTLNTTQWHGTANPRNVSAPTAQRAGDRMHRDGAALQQQRDTDVRARIARRPRVRQDT